MVPYGALETGEVARQANGAVLVDDGRDGRAGDRCRPENRDPGRDFFPLTVNYIEKTYAAGAFPGGFFKREGRPTERETLTSRLIDRPIRPLFPDGFINEVQVVATVLSLDPEHAADIPALLGASAALCYRGRALQAVRSVPHASATAMASTCSIRLRAELASPSSIWWSPVPRMRC